MTSSIKPFYFFCSEQIIKLEFYLRLQNTENFVLIASRSKIGDTPIVLVSFHIFQISSSVRCKLNRFFILEINFCGGSILAEINFWKDSFAEFVDGIPYIFNFFWYLLGNDFLDLFHSEGGQYIDQINFFQRPFEGLSFSEKIKIVDKL